MPPRPSSKRSRSTARKRPSILRIRSQVGRHSCSGSILLPTFGGWKPPLPKPSLDDALITRQQRPPEIFERCSLIVAAVLQQFRRGLLLASHGLAGDRGQKQMLHLFLERHI